MSGSGQFDKSRLPDPVEYFASEGLDLIGRGMWRSTRCAFHDGSDSLRVHTRTGAWRCMNCGVSGGDVLSFHMQRYGLQFVTAARQLGAWVPGPWSGTKQEPRRFSARDALEVVGEELNVCVVVIGDARRGLTPSEQDWMRFLAAAGRVQAVAMEATR